MNSTLKTQNATESCMGNTEIILRVKVQRAIAVLQQIGTIFRPQKNKVKTACHTTKMEK